MTQNSIFASVNLKTFEMKKNLVLLLPAVGFFLILTAFSYMDRTPSKMEPTPEEFTIPDDVSAIFDKSCFGCHNSESQADKAKKKLLIDQLSTLSKAKLVGKLGEIGEVVEKNEMPPEKFRAKYPENALTDEESKRLKEWTDTAAEELLK